MPAATAGIPWPDDYGQLTQTIKTLLRAIFGDFSVNFGGAEYETTAELLFIAYLVMMALALLNLLITLLMSKYDEVYETMEKQFAFVRASAVHAQQDAVLQCELPPPFNLLQVVHPDRAQLAWVVWLLIWTPLQAAGFVLMWSMVTLIFVPPMLLGLWYKATFGGATPQIEHEFDEAERRKELEMQRRASSLHKSVQGGNHTPKQPDKPPSNIVGRIVRRVIERITMFVVTPGLFIISWVGFFMVLVVFAVINWIITTTCSIANACTVYLPAVKRIWRRLGAYLIDTCVAPPATPSPLLPLSTCRRCLIAVMLTELRKKFNKRRKKSSWCVPRYSRRTVTFATNSSSAVMRGSAEPRKGRSALPNLPYPSACFRNAAPATA